VTLGKRLLGKAVGIAVGQLVGVREGCDVGDKVGKLVGETVWRHELEEGADVEVDKEVVGKLDESLGWREGIRVLAETSVVGVKMNVDVKVETRDGKKEYDGKKVAGLKTFSL
jgi:hypothetical protein